MIPRRIIGKKDPEKLSMREKRTLSKAVKRTVKDYKKTLDLLAKT